MILNTFMQIPSDEHNISRFAFADAKLYCDTTTIKTCLLNFETYLTHSAVYVALYSEAIFLDSARAAIQLVSS